MSRTSHLGSRSSTRNQPLVADQVLSRESPPFKVLRMRPDMTCYLANPTSRRRVRRPERMYSNTALWRLSAPCLSRTPPVRAPNFSVDVLLLGVDNVGGHLEGGKLPRHVLLITCPRCAMPPVATLCLCLCLCRLYSVQIDSDGDGVVSKEALHYVTL